MAEKRTNKAKINYFVDLIIAVGFLLTAVSGLVLAHLALHWKWFVCMSRNLLRRRGRAGEVRAGARSCPVEG